MISKERFLSFQDPERNHERVLKILRVAERHPKIRYFLRKIFDCQDPKLEVDLFGLHFTNPIGLAAGFDKNCQVPKTLASFGFGHVEVGTVTSLPQEGNQRPRIWKLIEDRAVINWMGMPNLGLEIFTENLRKVSDRDFILGVNIGKSEITPIEEAFRDYKLACRKTYPYADYIAINVSSPNTPELRRLQSKKLLGALIGEIRGLGLSKPILLKIDPDLSFPEIDDIIKIAGEHKIDGIIATNTTVSRENLKSEYKDRPGGLSGLPLKKPSTEIIRYIYRQTEGSLPIIGVGGIFNAEDALEKIRAGASLVQIYTGFVFDPLRGPFIARNINRGLSKIVESQRIKSVSELVGQE